MKHIFRRSGGGAAVLLGVLGAGWGCTDHETGLFIHGNVVREAPDCIARAEASGVFLTGGVLDVALKLDYQASLLVGSQLTPRGDKENLRTETMITTISGAEVQLYDDTGALDTEFTVAASGVILPDSSAEPGYGIINATLIPAATGVLLAADLLSRGQIITRVAQVKVFGETIGGVDVESAELVYVIRVCEGCLVDFPAEAIGTDGLCGSRQTDMSPDLPCRVGQDDVVDCRACAGFSNFCQTSGEIQ
jgi:hypothetical protein